MGLYAINNVYCEEIGLPKNSNADLAFCTTDSTNQSPKNIKLIFEIKMSILSNYKYSKNNRIKLIGDYTTHKGNPALLRSDSMLKAIGKSINIRVSGNDSINIPIIILGNSPITKSYIHKVDFLKKAGVIQGFWSLNPKPTSKEYVRQTSELGFQTFDKYSEIKKITKSLINKDLNYFSSMISKKQLGKLIRIANNEKTDLEKAEKFLQMIK